jgi:beta-glucosidase
MMLWQKKTCCLGYFLTTDKIKIIGMKGLRKIILLIMLFFSLAATAQTVHTDHQMKMYIDALMKKMTLQEKIGQLNLLTPGGGVLTGSVVSTDVETKIINGQVGGLFGVIGEEKIRTAQTLAVTKSHLHIPLLFGSDIIHGYKTTFPIPLGLSCSWDTALIKRSASIAATEATADGLCWAFSPMVDITRDPRWGRVSEGSGEDAFLGSQISKVMVQGYQGKNFSKENTLMACVKHFALYGAVESGREYNTVDMSRIRMYNEYLPPYKAAVDAGVGSVMTSFNEVDGIPATGNKWLLTDLLRNQWGFNGLIVSDYTSVNEMIAHGVGDLQAVSALALNAGLDMDMVGEGYLTTLEKSLQEKKVTLKQIDYACRKVLEAKYKLGLFEDPYRYCDSVRAKKEVLSNDKRMAAREIATHCFVLLKNNDQVLPLKRSGTIALIGPLADDKNNMLGTWAVSGDPQLSVPVLDGIKNVAGNNVTVVYAKGANITDDSVLAKNINVFGLRADIDKRSPDEMINEALKVAQTANVIVAVVGEASEMSGECASRTDITIPPSQKKLIRALSKIGKPLVLVVMSGRPLVLIEEDSLATAILQTWHAGTEAGDAIADVLFDNYDPSGKLTMSFPRSVGQIPIYYDHKNTGRPLVGNSFQKFRSEYIDEQNTPLYAFGYGLSYTKFSYSNISLNKTAMTQADKIEATVTITNTGNFDGEETAELYIQDVAGSITRPVKELKGFQKIFLKKGESKTVKFIIGIDDLKFYNSDLRWVAEPGDFNLFIGGSSDNLQTVKFVLL